MSTPNKIGSFKNRIKEFKYVNAVDILPNPRNWHVHGIEQINVMRSVLAEIGFVDALPVFETKGGYMLIDGALRTGIIGENAQIPVLVLDVTKKEADKILASFDPTVLMADVDTEKLKSLLEPGTFKDSQIQEALSKTMALLDSELAPPPSPKSWKLYDQADTDAEEAAQLSLEPQEAATKDSLHVCPNCGHVFADA